MYTLLNSNRSAMIAQQRKLDTISNNLANVNTTGYKKLKAQFSDLYQDTLERKGYPTTDGAENLNYGTGVKIGKAVRQVTQGSLVETGNNSDLAIDGQGFFKIYMADNTAAYTRSGSLKVDSAGTLVDGNGNRLSVVDRNGNEVNYHDGRMRLTNENFVIDKNGVLYRKEKEDFIEVGSIKTYDSIGDTSLLSVGESLFVPGEGTTMYETRNRNIQQGYLENSNVDVAQEMSDMILTQRAFQLSSTGLKTTDEMWGMINSLR